MRHLKCICFVRPTPETIQSLVDELREPKYGEYSIYFSNIVKKSSLERMAEADDHEVVKSVQVINTDFARERNRQTGGMVVAWRRAEPRAGLAAERQRRA